MRDRLRAPLVGVLIAGPFVLAFEAGGYFDQPRLIAGIAACALVAVAAIAWPRPLPASAPGRLALVGLALLAAWTAASIAWAPLSTPAVADAGRLLLYLAAFTAVLAIASTRGALRAIEPGIVAGALVVVLYGLSERLLPGVIDIANDASAFGRLSRPLTYWNAMGTMAALGVVLGVRVAGDVTRAAWLRAAAAAALAPLALGLYLSFSRGALAAVAAGVVLLALLARDRSQLRALGLAVAVGVIAALVATPLDGVRELAGPAADREREGALMLAVLVLLALAAGLLQAWDARRTRAAGAGFAALGPRARAAVGGAFALIVVAAFVLAAATSERRPAPTGATAARLTSTESTRGAYWSVAVDAFADDPLRGTGSGGFSVVWLRERDVPEAVRDAHSLPIETAAELGIVGLLALGLFAGGVGWGALRAYARDPIATAGPIAALAAWSLHAGLDWLWELPAVTLPALVLAAALLRRAEADAA